MALSSDKLLQDPRITEDYADPCKMHDSMEQIILEALVHRKYYQQTLEYAQNNPGNPPTYNHDLISQHQKDLAAVDLLTERIEDGKPTCINCKEVCHLASSFNNPKYPQIKKKTEEAQNPNENKNTFQANKVAVKDFSYANALQGPNLTHRQQPKTKIPLTPQTPKTQMKSPSE
ncbi:hypothetical protein TNCT_248231 [Trichonephila clavata]|uniref:Uncharacterized protein n=1 Tax=Trichonephila clavata TaxID=2740835 RepID=A0A8X6I6K3_TRICU|nr:hypothetical protein TNCT_248231 [Trichonephila clavata]